MLDLKFIRENPELVRENLKRRNKPDVLLNFEELIVTDKHTREKKGEIDELRALRNRISERINAARKAGQDAKSLIEEAKNLPERVKEAEDEFARLENKVRELRLRVPNLLHDSVPDGKDETQNEELRTFNKKPKFDFPLKSHADLLAERGLADFERAAKVAGARWYFLKGKITLLDLAIQHYAMDFLAKRKFTPVIPPHMLKRAAMEGVLDLAAFEDMIYKIDNEDLYVIGTAEHPLTAQYMDEVLDEKQLPITLAGLSTNFRKEAGAHGKDQKGIFRVHQFTKVEQIVICKPEDSEAWHEKLLMNMQDFVESLGLHGHVITLCSGDTGNVSSKTYDAEAWYPVQNAYREVGSCSNVMSYQAVRLNIRYTKANGEREYVHTLNSTLVPTSRIIAAIIENFQNKDGKITVPKALHKYTGFKEI